MADHVSRCDVNNNFNIQGRASTSASAEIRNVVVDTAGAVTVSGTITSTPSAVGTGTAAAAARVVAASDSPDVTSLATIVTQTAPLVPGGNLVDTTGTAGTPEQINGGNSQVCRGVMLSNWSSGAIAAGFSNAVDVTLKTGCTIGAGKSMFFPCTNTNQIWVDVTTSGDAYGGVYYT